MIEYIPQTIIVFAITSLFIWRCVPLAVYLGFIDKPGGHKTHQGQIPVIGGLAMFVGISTSIILLGLPIEKVMPVMMAGLLVLIIGMLDDKLFLSAYTRFLIQISAALIFIMGDNVLLMSMGQLVDADTFYLRGWALPITIFATVGVINSLNMVDGLDGLAGSLSIVTFGSVAMLFSITGDASGYFIVPVIFISAVMGFLMFNLRTPWLNKAKIFMGNGGSMLLGVFTAWLLIKFSQGPAAAFNPAVALWIFAIPLLDTVTIMLRRIKKGRSPFCPDQEHLHHLFMKMGFSVGQSVSWVIGVASVLAILGIFGQIYHFQEATLFYGFLILFALYFLTMEKSWKAMHTRLPAEASNQVLPNVDHPIVSPVKRNFYKD